MTTKSNNLSSNSLGFIASQTYFSSQSHCNICGLRLHAYEEIIQCRICQLAFHWRCAKPDTITYYGENKSFICDQCSEDHPTVNSTNRLKTESTKTDKLTSSTESDLYRDYTSSTSKVSSSPNVVNATRYSNEKQQTPQTYRTTKTTDFNDYLTSTVNDHEYSSRYGQHKNDTQNSKQIQQQENFRFADVKVNDDDNQETSTMFQANYQYTPLKDFAASNHISRNNDEPSMSESEKTNVRSGKDLFEREEENQIIFFTLSNEYDLSQDSPTNRSNRPKYANGLQYNNHGYDPTVARLIEIPRATSSTQFSSPTIENLSAYNRQQQHFVSTTNLNLNEKSNRRIQQTPPNEVKARVRSSPYLAQNHIQDSPPLTASPTRLDRRQHSPSSHAQISDQNSAVGSDSGIVIVTPKDKHHYHKSTTEENTIVEKKLTDLVQQLGKQLETDAQKINEKLESKLKNLEDMIHQQTYIIRRQDEVIERLKTKISKIEGERDHFRERLSYHEQGKQNETEKKPINQNKPPQISPHRTEQNEDFLTVKSNHDSSSTKSDNSKVPPKKAPAPRIDPKVPQTDENEIGGISALIKQNPITKPVAKSEQSPKLSTIGNLVRVTPTSENPTATKRLNEIIHHEEKKQAPNVMSSSYNMAEIRHQNFDFIPEPIPLKIENVISTVHKQNEDERDKSVNESKSFRSRSQSASSSASSARLSIKPTNINTTNLRASNDQSVNVRRSYEVLPQTTVSNNGLRVTNRTASLDIRPKPENSDDSNSIYITPTEANQPANQTFSLVKGWLRKQNRDSIFKRIERYYCVLTTHALLMHRRDDDRLPYKAISLAGAQVVYYQDQKHGPSLELTWAKTGRIRKHYHFYPRNSSEAQEWLDGIQATIRNLDKSQWQHYQARS